MRARGPREHTKCCIPPDASRRCFSLSSVPSVPYAVPLDSAYLSNSPFMLNVPHAVSGLTTVGLQCLVPQPSLSSGTRITVTPAEVAGYNLQLGLTSQGMETSFTYSLNSANDPNFSTLGGWAQPAVDIANPASPSNDYKTNFFVFIGMRCVSQSTGQPFRASHVMATFSQPAVAAGYIYGPQLDGHHQWIPSCILPMQRDCREYHAACPGSRQLRELAAVCTALDNDARQCGQHMHHVWHRKPLHRHCCVPHR